MKNFKRIISMILCFAMISSLLNKQVNAIEIIENTALVINNEIVEEMLIDSGYGGNTFQSHILYNNENVPSYTLGISENGYIIVENETLTIHEYGEGNPYVNADGNLFYAGPLNYYNVENNVITDLTTMEIVNDMAVSLSIVSEINNGDVSIQSTTDSTGLTRVSNYYPYIQRIAFGNNSNNVCGAIAVQIVLNYLELQTGNDFVHSTHKSELLSVSTSYLASRYPKAAAMLTHLVNTCGIGTNAIFTALVGGLSIYVDISNIADKSLSASWAFNPSTNTIKNNISNNKPVILLTQGHPTYGDHYMVAYGYRTYTNGNINWMVHTGRYGDNYITYENGVYRHQDKFINDTYVDYAIYFSY